MKRLLSLCVGMGLLAVLCPSEAAVKIGEKVGKLEFKDIRYLVRTLDDLGSPKGTVLVFLNSDCPVAKRFIPRLKELDAAYSEKGIQFVGVYCSQNETINDMASHALESGIRFHVVKDEDHSVCDMMGVERVPTVVLLDGERNLVYRGRISDQYRVGGAQPKVGREDLAVALDELLADKSISVSETSVDGCKVTPIRKAKLDYKVTFHEHVSGIMQKRCQSCHHDGTPTPFSLVEYQDVADHSEMVLETVVDRRMPPWYASPKYNHFNNDPSMTAEERDLVQAWVEGGLLEGDKAKAPKPLVFEKSVWKIGKPDLVVKMTQQHDVQADGFVPYKYVTLPYIFKEDTYVEAIEIRPVNMNVVHHCNMAYLNVGTMKGGRETFITGYVPGGQPMVLSSEDPNEPKVAYKIPRGSMLVLQIHYTTTGKPEKGSIEVGFRYAKSGLVDKTTHFFVLDPRPIAIPPFNAMWEMDEEKVIPKNATLLGMFTHMHVRGRDMTFKAHYPDGKSETLLQIPNYNFEWQLGYEARNKIPAGTKIQAVAHYDNSTFNTYNPDPKRTVPYGDQTYDEMFNGFVFWVYDDEQLNLKVDPSTGTVVKEKSKDVASKE